MKRDDQVRITAYLAVFAVIFSLLSGLSSAVFNEILRQKPDYLIFAVFALFVSLIFLMWILSRIIETEKFTEKEFFNIFEPHLKGKLKRK